MNLLIPFQSRTQIPGSSTILVHDSIWGIQSIDQRLFSGVQPASGLPPWEMGHEGGHGRRVGKKRWVGEIKTGGKSNGNGNGDSWGCRPCREGEEKGINYDNLIMYTIFHFPQTAGGKMRFRRTIK